MMRFLILNVVLLIFGVGCTLNTRIYGIDSKVSYEPTLTLKNPVSPISVIPTPTITVSGVPAGVTVKLFKDSSCSSEIASQITASSSVDVTTQTLSVGTHTIYMAYIDSSGIQSTCSTVMVNYTLYPPFVLNNATLVTGETAQFSASGAGGGPFVYSLVGLGNVNANSGLYTAPLNITPQSVTIKATDSLGLEVTAQAKIRAFETKDTFMLDSTGTQATSQVFGMSKDGSGNMYALGSASGATIFTYWIVLKSSDSGATWTTVDRYIYSDGGSAVATAMTYDSSGIYVVGSGYDPATSSTYWIVRKSTDGGATWATIDSSINNVYSPPNSITTTGSGALYVAGSIANTWKVRKSSDYGTSWSNVDSYELSSGKPSVAKSVIIDQNGHIVVAGTAQDSGNVNHWIVRKSINNGTSWTTVDDYQLFSGRNSKAAGISKDGLGNLFVTGEAINGTNTSIRWNVRKSTDFGATWSTVEDFQISAGNHCQPVSIATDTNGVLYVSGYSYIAPAYHWVVRKSSNNGTSWSTVQDYTGGTPATALSFAVATDANNNVYAGGYGYFTDATGRWIIQKSTDGGSTWSMSSSFILVPGKSAISYALTKDSSGNIYSGGSAGSGSSASSSAWLIRKTTDNGATWSTVDNYNLSGGTQGDTNSVLVDQSGNVFGAGSSTDGTASSHWIVRKSSNGGSSWATVDDYQLSNGQPAVANALALGAATGTLYTAGYGTNGSSRRNWIVRKSTDSGATWTTVDAYIGFSTFDHAMAASIKLDLTGNIFVAGYVYDSSTFTQRWIIRKSTDAGATWSNVDNFRHSNLYSSIASGLTIDSNNTIYVSGYFNDSFGRPKWLLRKSTDSGATWASIDEFRLTGGTYSHAYGITTDSSGNIWAVGTSNDTNVVPRWIVKKSSDQGNTWTIVENIGQTSNGYSGKAYAVVPCFNNQICVAGSLTISNFLPTHSSVRVLSPQ